MHLNYLGPVEILHLSILTPLRVQNGGAQCGETAVADYLAAAQSICLYPDFPWDSPPWVAAVAWWMKYPYFTDMAGNVLHFIIPVFYASMNCFNVTSIKSQESILWVQFIEAWLTLCNPMDCNTQGLRVHHQLPQSLFTLMSVESVRPSNYLILCHPFLLPPSIFPSIRVFSNESVLWIS